MNGPLLVEQRDATLVVTINREAKCNALSGDVATGLLQVIEETNGRSDLRAVIIQGAGTDSFSAGADLKERAAADSEGKWKLSRNLLAVNRAILASPKIFFASIRGWCLGGGLELALSCDFRIAEEKALFGWPEIKLGAYPGAGAAVLLPRIIGMQAAKQFLLSARNMNASQALSIGLIDRCIGSADPISLCLEMALDLEQVAPAAQGAIKASLQSTMHLSLDEAFAVDGSFRKPLESTRDYQEGILAHFEKRKPVFTGT